ncbi:restriction endonuclease [uncultured Shewanella sp.]|uniref:restriction endonuclease n=1 Tax=uncultured Shewanella sp. TaxID=173975 RepID=UPI0026026579|nr:restriction endonuclease [uncultured Shewanella sp.]
MPAFIFVALILGIINIGTFFKQESYRYTKGINKAIRLERIDTMDGLEFEHYVAWLLSQKNYTDVEVTKGSGDFGADIIACRNGRRYTVQVKRHAQKISRRAISDACAAKDYYNCTNSMVVTNNYFTQNAIEFAMSVNCELIDRDTLGSWILDIQRFKST